MSTMVPTDQLMDHVRAYAASVRSHLSDLPPELVDDLTDGLEADLADALQDPAGPVATGEVPLVRPGVGAEAGMIDLRARFGPAEEYAAELRAAAGLAPAGAARRATVRDGVRGWRERAAERVRRVTRPVTSSRHWPAVEEVLLALTPVWWVLRGWVWFVVLAWAFTAGQGGFVPRDLGSALVLAALVLVSVQVARGRVTPTRRWLVRTLRAAHVLAVVLVVPLLLAFWDAVENRAAYGSDVVYVEGPAHVVSPEAGVWVDGMQVSNLFVYDAEGNPLEGVQVFDDRGRQVRTVEDPWTEWQLPGVDEGWAFGPVEDADGRVRWNVYPLQGAPWDRWVEDEEGGRSATLRTPPWPFAKAPAVPSSVVDDVPDEAPGAAGAPGGSEADAGTTPEPGTGTGSATPAEPVDPTDPADPAESLDPDDPVQDAEQHP